MVQQRQRPTGVTILAVLSIIGGVGGLIDAILFTVGGGMVASTGAAVGSETTTSRFIVVEGFLWLIVGILYIVMGVGFLRLSPWAWTLGIALAAISAILEIIFLVQGNSPAIPVIGILIAAGIIYSLTRPNVRQAFGRA